MLLWLTNMKNTEIMIGVYLLLGDQPHAQFFFDQLEKERQIEFLKYPINRFGVLTIPLDTHGWKCRGK